MNIRQFATSLSIIHRSEHANRPAALMRHVFWQFHKLASPWPIRRQLSRSVLMDDEPGGVIGLVNMLGIYDYNNMSFVQRVLSAGAVFVDVGANIGAYTLIASENPEVAVLSLEPNTTAFLKLERNVALNGRANVTAINRAASARPGTLLMTDNGADPTNRVVSTDAKGRIISVQADTLDAICRARGVWPTLIKIDVEGHELDVLEGAGACLVGVLALIVENGDRPAVVDIMRRHGLRGPFHYRHRLGRLQPQAQLLAEDQIFIGPGFEAGVAGVHVAAE